MIDTDFMGFRLSPQNLKRGIFSHFRHMKLCVVFCHLSFVFHCKETLLFEGDRAEMKFVHSQIDKKSVSWQINFLFDRVVLEALFDRWPHVSLFWIVWARFNGNLLMKLLIAQLRNSFAFIFFLTLIYRVRLNRHLSISPVWKLCFFKAWNCSCCNCNFSL